MDDTGVNAELGSTRARSRGRGDPAARRSGVSAQWRKAPFVLRHHPTVLAAVAAAAFLIALAAASSPFVRAAAGSVALKDKLDEFSAYTAGLEIVTGEPRPLRGLSVDKALESAEGRDARVAQLGSDLGFVSAPVVAALTPAVSATTSTGFTQIVLMNRTGDLDHVTKLSQVPGDGLWISDIAAGQLKVKAGDHFNLTGSDFQGGGHDVPVRVKGIYRALAYQTEKPYWNNFYRDIYPEDLDSPPPPGFAFTDRRGVLELAKRVGGLTIQTRYELPVDPKGLTLDTARGLARRFHTLEQALTTRTSLPVRRHGTPGSRPYMFSGPGGCQESGSLLQAVSIAASEVSAVSPVLRLLSAVGVGIALAVASAAGVFAVRRRIVEA